MSRVIAYYMHEHEEAACRQALIGASWTESFAVGEADAAAIAQLRAAGIVVSELPDPAADPETPGLDAHPLPNVALRRSRGAPRDIPRDVRGIAPVPVPGPDEPDVQLVQLSGPLLLEQRQAIEAVGAAILEYVPHNFYVVRCSANQRAAIAALPYVVRTRRYEAADAGPIQYTVPADAPRGLGPGVPAAPVAMRTWELLLHPGADASAAVAELTNLGVPIAGSSTRKVRVYVLDGSPLLDRLGGIVGVARVDEWLEPKLHNDVARTLLGIDPPPGRPGIGLTGAGQIVAVADTGLDDQHPDFQGRIVGLVALGRPGDASDPHGHGTHVAGSVLGDGAASGGMLRGVAPGAQLFFQSVLDAQGRLGGLPLDLGDLFEEAYQAGARIHNNSWGAATPATYPTTALEVDAFVAARRDMLIVISAGNEGQARQRLHAAPGFVDWLSVGSPATSKNALTVGASRSGRNQGGLASLTYGDAFPDAFPDSPIAAVTVSGDPQCLAAFSSRGPCDDRRIKPDVVAPGTDIASAKSSRASLGHFWGPFPGNARYAFMGGTSMAAPLVAGCAALVREHYATHHNHAASAALLKATLIAGTRWLSGADANADFPAQPNLHQGFGAVDVAQSVPNAGAPGLSLAFADRWAAPADLLTRTGERRRWRLTARAGRPLSICLAYTDAPGRALQNNLNLIVELPDGTKRIGNATLAQAFAATDVDNNVELVRIDPAPAGDYTVMVSASNLLTAGQDFALVASGDVDPLQPM